MFGVKFSPGFYFSAIGGNQTTSFVVTVCGHESVGWPLARNMDPIAERYLDEIGLDNLIIPISVGTPQTLKEAEFDFSINVVVHPCLTKRIKKSFRLCGHYIEKLTVLALQWIQQECGIQLVEKSCKLLGLQKGYQLSTQSSSGPRSLEEIAKAAAAAAAAVVEKEQKKASEASSPLSSEIPKELQLSTNRPEDKKKTPLIQEVIQEKGIKKGFLADSKRTLYGPEGTKEGSGKTPDPLAHIPESLRNKCTIIDTRDMSVKTPAESSSSSSSATAGGGRTNGASPPHATAPTPTLPPAVAAAAAAGSVFDTPTAGEHCQDSVEPIRVNAPTTPASTAATILSEWTHVSTEEKEGKLMLCFASSESITSMANVNLEVTATEVQLDRLVVKIDKSIDPDGVLARFSKAKHRLVVTCPLAA